MADSESANDGNGDRLDIAISGGSMGGLFTGLALDDADRDVNVEVFERSTGELRSRGAGIVAQPTILDFIETHSIADPEAITTTTSTRQYLDRRGGVERVYDESMTFTSWDGLYRRLRDAFPDENYHPGRTTIDIDESGTRTHDMATESNEPTDGGHGEGPTLRFENGETLRTDVAVVAEGGQSAAREELLPEVVPEYAGYVAWRGVTPEGSVPPDAHERFEDTFTFYEGSDDLVLAYLIPGPDGSTDVGKRRLNWVWYDSIERTDRRRLMTDLDGRTHEFSVPPGDLRTDVDEGLLTGPRSGSRVPSPTSFGRPTTASSRRSTISKSLERPSIGSVCSETRHSSRGLTPLPEPRRPPPTGSRWPTRSKRTTGSRPHSTTGNGRAERPASGSSRGGGEWARATWSERRIEPFLARGLRAADGHATRARGEGGGRHRRTRTFKHGATEAAVWS
jgi:2-polyprenyl-6-methoxyphenol hydroxylase-like FAD-dependent oxidoreductase